MTIPSIMVAVRATLKLNQLSGERGNVYAFIQSHYGRRPRRYDRDQALWSLARLTEEERLALIEYIVRS